jgi:hypothetical protein
MKARIARRCAVVTAGAALIVGGLATSPASAYASDMVIATGPHNVGIYTYPNTSVKATSTYWVPGDGIFVDCWTRGQTINNLGNVWYHTTDQTQWPNDPFPGEGTPGYAYGAYVDGNAWFHSHTQQQC